MRDKVSAPTTTTSVAGGGVAGSLSRAGAGMEASRPRVASGVTTMKMISRTRKTSMRGLTFTSAMGRLISLALRSGIPISAIHRQLRGISSDKVMGLGMNKVMSVPDAIGIAIEKWMQEKAGVQTELPGMAAPSMENGPAMEQMTMMTQGDRQMHMKLNDPQMAGACPDCGSQLEMAEGCAKCHVCGFSECG